MKKTVLILIIITIMSKLTGLAREITLSYFYGTSSVSDAYFISMIIPFVIFSFIGVSISSGYIPLFTKLEKEKGKVSSEKFTNNLINTLLIFSTFIVILIQIFTNEVVGIFATGFDEKTMNLAVTFTRITVFGVYFNVIIVIYNSFLQMKNSFIIPTLIGFIFNVFIIISIILSFKLNILYLAVGSLIALLFQLIILKLFSRMKKGLKYNFILDVKNENIVKLGKMSLPLIIGLSITQINVLVDKTLASGLAVGGISALNYADRLNSFILSSVVMSISVVIFPRMSSTIAENNINDFRRILSQAITVIIILIIPSTLGAMIFVNPIVDLLFARGAFDAYATSMTSAAFFYYSIGMIGVGLREVLSRAFYSLHDTKTPMINASFGVVLNILLNVILSKYMGIGGLALATSLSAILTTGLLFVSLKKKIGNFGLNKISIILLKVSTASIVMGIIAIITENLLALYMNNTLSLVLAVLLGSLTYLVVISFLKIEEATFVVKFIKKKIKLGA
ncbi:murein biosynthesis integral membrane protein MurJ [Bacillus sp. BHET2]|uniref:murein biosynthesis integral membrane protein MurJ n=1 Tax=Bacillus sp. BHET2 TaxID=2583818 RepID=UPI00110F38D9|nr:murein biosynthesis integral membrane protein MurJ [Bacillus sp. BHET2]TMU84123.1 murein biosynthesis integral membrane protein MurJ [Bacillus sp. BHET2]